MAAPAICKAAEPELTYSFPGVGTTEREPVPFVRLGFGGPVDMVTLVIVDPDDTETEIYNAATDLAPMKKHAMFAITLSTSLDATGDYRINYTITVMGDDSSAETRNGAFSMQARLLSGKFDAALYERIWAGIGMAAFLHGGLQIGEPNLLYRRLRSSLGRGMRHAPRLDNILHGARPHVLSCQKF